MEVLLYVELERYGEKRLLNQAFAYFVADDIVCYKTHLSYWLDGMIASNESRP